MTTPPLDRPGVLDTIRGGLIVSCQAYPGEPLRDPRTMTQMALAAVAGGAAAVRAQGLADIVGIVAAVDVPVVGLWKDGHDGVFITPTLDHALAVAQAGAHVVALDGTRRPRPDGLDLATTVARLREEADVLVMADCGSLDDALAAQSAGVDLLGTTLAGYTGERPRTAGPDLELVDQMVATCSLPVVVEGRVHTPAQAAAAMAHGAFSVCVGTAITHPTTLTTWFTDAIGTETAAEPPA
ncbi:N-acetylmannosamine-6-phosphate 2-epimerase [Oerskovia flava]|uniref:N-acetylmannosamine-6-phosphate 2-epimerase n=1 Tax=Oerskovia flava TaxID=2986422 RepID=UPI00223F7FD6|nr:N-acetylmannosamine-6-phosphate 2-epimerase [Oerskovia sp. JB1-3-2]